MPKECNRSFPVNSKAELADTYRMPAMLFADGMLGQMMEPISFPEKQVKPFDKFSWAACGHQGKRKHKTMLIAATSDSACRYVPPTFGIRLDI